MPEGHTIHRIARDHNQWFVGQRLAVLSPQGRFHREAAKLTGRVLRSVTAHGKHLFYHWTSRTITHVHLGLYGKFRLHQNPPPDPRGAVRLRMIGWQRSFDLTGPNRCELIDRREYRRITDRLGQDPLRIDAEPELVWRRFQSSRAAVGSLLLDQSVIAGVGNVYRAEILFLLGIHPQRAARELERDEFDRMWKTITELLKIGVKYNRIITVHHGRLKKPLSRLNSSERTSIYKKSTCPACGSAIQSWLLANRKMFACETCQR